jgi:hypothetical protein
MTKKDFFILLIKLFGLFSIITTLFSLLPGMVSFAFMSIDLLTTIWIIFVIVIIVGLFILLIFKSNAIVKLLKLDRGFDEDTINLGNISAEGVVKIGAFIIGGLLIINNIPAFLSHAYIAINETEMEFLITPVEKFNWAMSALNILLGYLLITNYSFVAKLLRAKESQ